jgi:hypothetical protein
MSVKDFNTNTNNDETWLTPPSIIEALGEFVRISQPNITNSECIIIREFGEWIVIRTQIDRMFTDIERLDSITTEDSDSARPPSSSELKSKRLRGVL